jgi:hypothetical protein
MTKTSKKFSKMIPISMQPVPDNNSFCLFESKCICHEVKSRY